MGRLIIATAFHQISTETQRVPQDLHDGLSLSSAAKGGSYVQTASRRDQTVAESPGERLVATAALATSMLLTPVPARADNAVLEWNQIALAATVTAAQGPLPQIRTMAIVHVSVHDAVNAITCDYRTYLPVSCGRWGSPEAAAIAAAHRALVGLFPAQAPALDAARAASLASRGLTEGDPGITFGEAVAALILAIRSNDGSAQAQFPYTAPGAGDAWSVGRRWPCACPVTRLGQRQLMGPEKPSRNSSRTVRLRCIAGAMRATSTR